MDVQESQRQRSISISSSIKSGKINQDQDQDQGQVEVVAEHPNAESRPPLDYSSFGNFWASVGARLRSVLTKRFILALLGGQVVSICITCTSVTTTELVNRGWSLPTTQTFFLYFALFVVYTPFTIFKYGLKGWGSLIIRDGWKYFILAACDVEGNFLVVKSYEFTNLLSCMLLDAWAIPACAFFAWIYMRPKYHWTQLIGILICVGGLGMLVASDHLTGTGQYPASSMVKGDLFMLAGATLYGFTNATEEFLVRKRPLYEVVGQLGMYGMIINAIQASGLEHKEMREATWNGAVIGLLFAYTIAMFILYTTAPLIYRAASSVYYNLSLLSSDFYGLLFGLGLYKYRVYWLYFVAFAVIIVGLVTYFWHSTPEEQGILDPQRPEYVQKKTGSTPV
ncbi:putative solute carrier family 35 member C320,08 [Schizosaccharomyces pombe 972h-] [Rhizoctonia solani]|uniref:Putative solute carrier family 35 member C320,08 [Schizosaccharomyces pombe 972h-] n=1 Tax=Rhizoctonia solani TaxID=456999 RepID=A0A0K6FWJ5_9AGAM|nr:putative solute carrier family 35 member C320,08 [Schizosaccharomyces pombe 972h-] [Rhizoctonia solani]